MEEILYLHFSLVLNWDVTVIWNIHGLVGTCGPCPKTCGMLILFLVCPFLYLNYLYCISYCWFFVWNSFNSIIISRFMMLLTISNYLNLIYLPVKTGRPGYRITKQFDSETKQRSFLFQVTANYIVLQSTLY